MNVYRTILFLSLSSLIFWVGCQAETAVSTINDNVMNETVVAQVDPTNTRPPPTETAVPVTPTAEPTSIPPTATPTPTLTPTTTPTPEPLKVTDVTDLIGYWEYDGVHSNGGGQLHYIYHFRADGILETADSMSAFRAGEIKARTDFWFEDEIWHTQLVTGFWRNSTCFLGTGKPITGKYEIRPEENGVLRFYRMSDICQVRNFSLSDNNATLTPIVTDNTDWFHEPETGYLLNPSEFPLNEPFVLIGTMLDLDTTDGDAPIVTLRVPSGEVVILNAPPLTAVQIEGDDDVDLTAYDPAFPMRTRLLVQAEDEKTLVAQEMIVFTIFD